MTSITVTDQLQAIASTGDFACNSAELTESWSAEGVSVDVVDSILEFMETHTDLDYGTPGAVVHFVEQYYGRGYEGKLLVSIRRKPTPHTVWMLNRLINGTREVATRELYITAMKEAQSNPLASPDTLDSIRDFLIRFDQ